MTDRAPLLDALLYRIDDLLALGDTDALDRDLAQLRETAEEVGEPFYDYCLLTKQAMRALLAGRFEEAEYSAQQSMEYSQNLQVDNAKGVYGMQMFSIRRLQGALRGLAPVIEHFMATHAETSRWRPGLALVCAEIGEVERARAEFGHLAADDFAGLPRDSLWLTSLSYLADVCASLGDADRAATLQQLLLPYGEQSVVVGNSITCNGAVSRSLARLATVRGEWDEAERQFRHALDFNERLRALPWLALTRFQYAAMLIERGRGEDQTRIDALMTAAMDSARALGMRGLERAAEDYFKQTAPDI
jgi:tetratricopeptide (TPR) repeat protein